MPRRTKTKSFRLANGKSPVKKIKTDLRFNISLVFLMAMLMVSAYLLLFALDGNSVLNFGFGNPTSLAQKGKTNVSSKAISLGGSQNLEDPSLDFKLTVPSRLGQWMYRTGYVKGLTDDTLSDQFVKIYIAQKPVGNSASFDECFKDVLTIRKFSDAEWKELEKGCQKKNQIYCEGMGEKISEKNGSVWAYTESEGCSGGAKTNCANIEKMIGSFQLK
jgi:hypothetical protein